MKEIEVNEYVRTNKIIARAIGKDDDNNILLNTQQIVTKAEEKIVKHSKNLIDLIEVGDYVNGHRVVNEIWGEDDNNLYFEIEGGVNKVQYIGEEDIETILTKEQYQANCYKVEEKE